MPFRYKAIHLQSINFTLLFVFDTNYVQNCKNFFKKASTSIIFYKFAVGFGRNHFRFIDNSEALCLSCCWECEKFPI